jgi:hypothetical protein
MELTRNASANQQHRNDASLKVELTIHNQFPGIELVSPIYASDSATCYPFPDQRIDVDSIMQTGFNIDLTQDGSTCALMYKLQRKNTEQPNDNIISSEDEITCTQLLITWKVSSSKEFLITSYLIEHDESHILDSDRLMIVAKRSRTFNIQHSPIEDTWLIYDNRVLMTSLNVTHEEECYKLEITVSETSVKDDTQRPRYIDLDR